MERATASARIRGFYEKLKRCKVDTSSVTGRAWTRSWKRLGGL